MTLIEKFKTLTPEQQEKFYKIKNEKDFDAFLNEYNFEITDVFRTKVLEYIKTDQLPLSDEDLENVSGGKDDGQGEYWWIR